MYYFHIERFSMCRIFNEIQEDIYDYVTFYLQCDQLNTKFVSAKTNVKAIQICKIAMNAFPHVFSPNFLILSTRKHSGTT